MKYGWMNTCNISSAAPCHVLFCSRLQPNSFLFSDKWAGTFFFLKNIHITHIMWGLEIIVWPDYLFCWTSLENHDIWKLIRNYDYNLILLAHFLAQGFQILQTSLRNYWLDSWCIILHIYTTSGSVFWAISLHDRQSTVMSCKCLYTTIGWLLEMRIKTLMCIPYHQPTKYRQLRSSL